MDSRNYSYDLLKLIAINLVIFLHACLFEVTNISAVCSIVRNIAYDAVPIFMLISFYFFNKIVGEENKIKFRKRIFKLAYTYVMWFLLYSIIIYIFCKFFHLQGYNSINLFIKQFLTGTVDIINHPMWYLLILIFVMLIMFFIIKCKHYKKILITIFAFCFIFQYSSFYAFLQEVTSLEVRYSYLRIFEMLPYAIIGVLIKEYDLIAKLEKYKIVFFILTFILYFIYIRFDTNSVAVSAYSGIFRLVRVGICFLSFSYITIKPKLGSVLQKLIKFNLGIYSIHWGIMFFSYIYNMYYPDFVFFSNNPLVMLLYTFLLSYLICFGISYIPGLNKIVK